MLVLEASIGCEKAPHQWDLVGQFCQFVPEQMKPTYRLATLQKKIPQRLYAQYSGYPSPLPTIFHNQRSLKIV